jgi:hypothetical protein
MDKFLAVKNKHLALTQYYRWYQVYEVPFTPARIDNQLDILDPDVIIDSVNGVARGTANLEDRLRVFEGWQNAHHVQRVEVQDGPNQTLLLEADILYQNIRPDDTRYNYTIHYSTVLRLRDNDLPLFTKITLRPTGTVEPPGFQSAYAENRAKSFMHYWLYLMETPETGAPKFRELLADGFQLHLSTAGMVDSLDAFEAWIQSIPTRMKLAAHYPKDFSVLALPDGGIKVSVNFDWEGISADNQSMVAETHHEWILENNPDERFARMKYMQVEQVRPFQVV